MSKIKVLQAIRQGKIGGGESHVLELVNHLDTSIYEPVVLSFTEGPMVDALNKKGINNHVIYTEKPFNMNIWKKVKELMQKEKIDMVHAHGTRALSNTYKAAKDLKLPLLYTVHGWSFHKDQFFPLRFIRERVESFLTSNCDKTICVSQSNKLDGEHKFNLKRSEVIHNAIDTEKFNPDLNFKDIRKELGISKGAFLIGYIVRCTAQKDPFTMLSGFKIIADNHPNAHLLMVGDGELKEQVIKKADELKLTTKITFQPFRTDIPDILNAIDLYCLPSLWEGFPIGILEAMAMKVPVVATPVDGTKELISNHFTGEFINEKDPEDMALKISKLILKPNLINLMTHKAYEYVTKNFQVDGQVEKIQKLYNDFAFSKTHSVCYETEI